MKPTRIIFHGFLLLIANITGVLAGFMVYGVLGSEDQLGTQLPIAIIVSVLLYLAWAVILPNLKLKSLLLRTGRECGLAGLCSLLWNPIVFIPLHYITQGYLTATGNILALAVFQVPVNTVALLAAWKLTQSCSVRDFDEPSRNTNSHSK